MLRIAYAIEDDRYPGLRDYYYELPQDIEKALDEDVELVPVPDLYNNDWTRTLIPIYNGAEVRGEGCAEEDWYFEKIAKATRRQVTKLDRKVWAAMQALPGVVR